MHNSVRKKRWDIHFWWHIQDNWFSNLMKFSKSVKKKVLWRKIFEWIIQIPVALRVPCSANWTRPDTEPLRDVPAATAQPIMGHPIEGHQRFSQREPLQKTPRMHTNILFIHETYFCGTNVCHLASYNNLWIFNF